MQLRRRYLFGALLLCATGVSVAIYVVGLSPRRLEKAATPSLDATPTPPARKLEMSGVPKFGQVTPTLYRGAEPTDEGLRQLKELGVGIVVCLRGTPDDEQRPEPGRVEALGMRHVAIPWSASQPPSHERVLRLLNVIQSNPKTTI